jgi:hypothetical protein
MQFPRIYYSVEDEVRSRYATDKLQFFVYSSMIEEEKDAY